MSDKPEDKKPEAIVVDRQFLDANHADVVDSIKAEAASDERERINGITSATLPGHEALAAKAIEDGTEPGAFALQLLGAEAEVRKGSLYSIEKDAPKTPKVETDAKPPVTEEGKKDEDLTVAERAEKSWNAEPAAHSEEFIGGKESYVRAFTAEANGKVKLQKK